MKRQLLRLFLALAILIVAAGAHAQPTSRINLDFPGLADRAEETVDVTLDASMLKLAAKFFSNGNSDERAIRDMVQKLQGIYVRSYKFEDDGEYDRRVVDTVRRQLGPTWKKIVNVKSKRENVEIYMDMRGENITGLVVIAAEDRELTVVNIVGPIDLDRLAQIEGQFGIPRVTEKKEREGRQ